jgi:hypothetical protein
MKYGIIDDDDMNMNDIYNPHSYPKVNMFTRRKPYRSPNNLYSNLKPHQNTPIVRDYNDVPVYTKYNVNNNQHHTQSPGVFSDIWSDATNLFTKKCNQTKILDFGHEIIFDGTLDIDLENQINSDDNCVQYHVPDIVDDCDIADYKETPFIISIVKRDPIKINRNKAVEINIILALDHRFEHLQQELEKEYEKELLKYADKSIDNDQNIPLEPISNENIESKLPEKMDQLPLGYCSSANNFKKSDFNDSDYDFIDHSDSDISDEDVPKTVSFSNDNRKYIYTPDNTPTYISNKQNYEEDNNDDSTSFLSNMNLSFSPLLSW